LSEKANADFMHFQGSLITESKNSNFESKHTPSAPTRSKAFLLQVLDLVVKSPVWGMAGTVELPIIIGRKHKKASCSIAGQWIKTGQNDITSESMISGFRKRVK
jgi:hypothetical protein